MLFVCLPQANKPMALVLAPFAWVCHSHGIFFIAHFCRVFLDASAAVRACSLMNTCSFTPEWTFHIYIYIYLSIDICCLYTYIYITYLYSLRKDTIMDIFFQIWWPFASTRRFFPGYTGQERGRREVPSGSEVGTSTATAEGIWRFP